RLFGIPNTALYTKDAFHYYLVQNKKEVVNPAMTGTKSAFYCQQTIGARQTWEVTLRLCTVEPSDIGKVYPLKTPFGGTADDLLAERRKEADEFYQSITPASLS